MSADVDDYLSRASKWKSEITLLRSILLDCDLSEALKWKTPCYSFKNKNIALIGAFKDYLALSFFKGVLLSDTDQILQSPGENSQSVKLIRFTSEKEISDLAPTIKAYIYEAIEVEKAQLKVPLKDNTQLELIEELTQTLDKNPELKSAFNNLTPGRQRGYNLYFSSAKQSATRFSRIEKYTPRILSGKGFHDCVCALSKKMPTCDGSHKQLEK